MEKVYEGRDPGVQSSLGREYGLDWRGVEGGIETDEGLLDGETVTMTEADQYFVGVVRRLCLRRGNGAWG